MPKGLIPQNSAYIPYAKVSSKKDKQKNKSKQPNSVQYKQRAEEIHHTQTSRGH